MFDFIKKNTVKFLFSIFLGYNIILVVFSNTGFPEQMSTNLNFPFLADKPVSEDTYYILTMAWNLAKGEGLVYNYGQPSTGVQPFITLIYSSFAFLIQYFEFSKWELIRTILIFNILLILLFYKILKKILDKIVVVKDGNDLILTTVCIFNFDLYRSFVYGLETGLYLVLFSLLVLYSINYFELKKTLLKSLFFGILIGVVILTRIDFLIVICVFFFGILLLKKITLTHLVLIILPSLIIILPWFIYVHIITGSIIPSSGTAQATLISMDVLGIRVVEIFIALATHLSPWLFSGGSLKIAVAGLIFIIFIFWYKKNYNKFLILDCSKNSIIFFIWLLSFSFLIPTYVVFFWATHFYIRYTAPLLIFVLSGIVFMVNYKLRNEVWRVVFVSGFLMLFFAQSYYAFHMGRISNSHLISASFIQRSFDESAKIGAFQSGVIGYFNKNVVNLDGKVNTQAVDKIKNKDLESYLDDTGIQVLIDWESYIHQYLGENYLKANWLEVDRLNNTVGKEVSICLIRRNIDSTIIKSPK